MTSTKISIIVPVYNVEKYIAECLDSLVGQTLRDIEIICVDDCSTDGSADIIRKYSEKDNRIKLVCKEKNSGQSDSRNIGLGLASAPYIMFCDSDDFYEPTMCEKMLDAICEHNADLAVCGINIIYEANPEMTESDTAYYNIKYSGTMDITEDIIAGTDISPCNKVFKKEILDACDIRFPTGLKYEDAYFFNVYVLWAQKISFIKDKLYNYRRRANSTMAQTFDKKAPFAIDHMKIAIKYFEYLKQHNLYQKKFAYFWKTLFIQLFYCIIQHCNNKQTLDLAFQTAHNFIDENYTWESLDIHTERILHLIYSGVLESPKKYLCGIVNIKECIEAKSIIFAGIAIYKAKYFPDYTKHYILGIQYKIKHF